MTKNCRKKQLKDESTWYKRPSGFFIASNSVTMSMKVITIEWYFIRCGTLRKGVASMGAKVLIFPHDIAYDGGKTAGEAQGARNTKRETAFETFHDGVSFEKRSTVLA